MDVQLARFLGIIGLLVFHTVNFQWQLVALWHLVQFSRKTRKTRVAGTAVEHAKMQTHEVHVVSFGQEVWADQQSGWPADKKWILWMAFWNQAVSAVTSGIMVPVLFMWSKTDKTDVHPWPDTQICAVQNVSLVLLILTSSSFCALAAGLIGHSDDIQEISDCTDKARMSCVVMWHTVGSIVIASLFSQQTVGANGFVCSPLWREANRSSVALVLIWLLCSVLTVAFFATMHFAAPCRSPRRSRIIAYASVQGVITLVYVVNVLCQVFSVMVELDGVAYALCHMMPAFFAYWTWTWSEEKVEIVIAVDAAPQLQMRPLDSTPRFKSPYRVGTVNVQLQLGSLSALSHSSSSESGSPSPTMATPSGVAISAASSATSARNSTVSSRGAISSMSAKALEAEARAGSVPSPRPSPTTTRHHRLSDRRMSTIQRMEIATAVIPSLSDSDLQDDRDGSKSGTGTGVPVLNAIYVTPPSPPSRFMPGQVDVHSHPPDLADK